MISVKTPHITPQNKDLPPLNHSVLSILSKVDAKQQADIEAEKSFDFKPHIATLLALKSTAKTIATAYKESGMQRDEFSDALFACIDLYAPNKNTKVSDFSNITTQRKVTMLLHVLTMLGILLNDQGNNYRWASTIELKKLTCKTTQLCNKVFGNDVIDTINKKLNQARLNRAHGNAYARVNGNEITKVRKSFTGQLTDKEKEAMRMRDETEAFKKLTSDAGVPLEDKQKIATIKGKALVEQAKRQAQWTETSDKLWQYTKVMVVIGLLIFVVTILTSGASSQADLSYETNISIMEAAK